MTKVLSMLVKSGIRSSMVLTSTWVLAVSMETSMAKVDLAWGGVHNT